MTLRREYVIRRPGSREWGRRRASGREGGAAGRRPERALHPHGRADATEPERAGLTAGRLGRKPENRGLVSSYYSYEFVAFSTSVKAVDGGSAPSLSPIPIAAREAGGSSTYDINRIERLLGSDTVGGRTVL